MASSRIVELLTKQPNVTNVELSNDLIEGNNSIHRYEGFLQIGTLKGNFVFRETPVMDVNIIGFLFEYTLLKKNSKEAIYEVINKFNRSKTGLKATLSNFTKGVNLSVFFAAETITPNRSELLEPSLNIVIPVLSSAPILFSKDLEEKKILHKSILGE